MNRLFSLQLINQAAKRNSINLTQVRHAFYNKYKHGPSELLNPDPPYREWVKEFFTKEGLIFTYKELWRLTVGKIFNFKEPDIVQYNTTYIFEHFDSDESIKRWKPVSDSDSLNGYSVSSIVRSKDGHALFKGVLDNKLPDDGITHKSGFAGVVGPARERQRILASESFYDWSDYNCVEIRFRGDGRKYMFVANTGSYNNDLSYFDVFVHPIYTKGGPYWETRKIYFSKMVFSYKRFIQDDQGGLFAKTIKFVAITLEDTYDGPFGLEIDYIGLRNDLHPNHDEECAYEMYTHPHIKFKQVHVECDPPRQSV